MFKFRRRMAFLAVPAVLALGAVSYGSATAFAATSPSPTAKAAPSTTEPAESTKESAIPEVAEPNEPALPGGGHADPDNVQADTQQEGTN
jgi:hypothetical protein